MPSANKNKTDFYRALVCALLLGLGGCGDDGAEQPNGAMAPASPDPIEDTEGLAMCCELGAICHPDGDDPLNSVKQMCHSLGHENEPAACRAQYDACIEACGSVPMEEPHACR